MFHFSPYSQVFPIIIPQPQSFAISLRSNQTRYYPRKGKDKSKPANKSITNGKQAVAQRTALKEGLQKSLDSTNKGFEILKKMGYEEGKSLGKDGTSGITKPLDIPIKDNPRDRAGLGQELKNVASKEGPTKSKTKATNALTAPASKAIVPKPVPTNHLSKREKRILQLETEYREDIELLRLRVQAELSVKAKDDNLLIIAQVAMTDESMCSKIFEIIHQYLINSLHVYTGNPYPMFHDIAHVDGEIKVVCEDKPSFEYLSSCITALSAHLSIPMTTTQIPSVGRNVYWFGVQIQGLVNEPQLFVTQINKHRFGLKPDRWIVITLHACPKANKTNLQIITDEQSAMLLIFRYSLKLFVCMQEMDFTLRAQIPFPT